MKTKGRFFYEVRKSAQEFENRVDERCAESKKLRANNRKLSRGDGMAFAGGFSFGQNVERGRGGETQRSQRLRRVRGGSGGKERGGLQAPTHWREEYGAAGGRMPDLGDGSSRAHILLSHASKGRRPGDE